MKPAITSIDKDIFGVHRATILYPNGAYIYRLKSARDADTLRYYRDMGWVGKMIKMVKRFPYEKEEV